MAYEECVSAIAKEVERFAGIALSHDEALDMLQSVLDQKNKIVAERALSGDSAFAEAARALSEKEAMAARASRLDALRNAAKRNAAVAEVVKNGGLKNAYESLMGILTGSNKFSRDNIQSMWHGISSQWQAVLEDVKLHQLGLKKVARSGELDRDVSAAWWKINAGESPGTGPAAEIAQLYSKAMDIVRERLNALGAKIGDAKDYVTRTSHDPVKIRQAAGDAKSPDEAFAAWWEKTEPRLADKTFDDIEPKDGQTLDQAKEAFGRSVFDSLVTGVHLKYGSPDEGNVPISFEGTRNIARSVSQDRTLFWKDGEAWHDYMQDFGQSPTLHASVLSSLDKGARQLALMDKLGTNPAGNLNLIMRKIEAKYRADPEGLRGFQNSQQRLRNVMGILDGSHNIPANMGIARGASAIRTLESTASLGGVGVTHGASIWATVPSELAHHGINRIDGLRNTLASLFRSQGEGSRREILADIGAYSDGISRHVQSVIGDDSIPGRISNMAGRFMDATGIHFIFDRTKAGIKDMLAHNLGRNVGKEFSQLDPHVNQMMGRYGISDKDWDLVRSVQDLPVSNDRAYLTPSVAQRINPDSVAAHLRATGVVTDKMDGAAVGKQVDSYRQRLSDRLLSYYSDAAEHGVVTAGARERSLSLLGGGTRPGTLGGEFLRFFAQFKMWPVAAMHQILDRDIYMALDRKEAAWNIGKLIAIGVPAGYMRMAINDLATGRPVRDPRDPKTLLAAASQSGGLGILGDFLFGETSRMGGGLVSTLGGPVIGDADSLVKLFNGLKEGKTSWPDIAHFGVRHIPFANLVYLKGALDYMLWYHLYEAASPGWWERTNRRLLKEQGRTMTGYAPGRGIPWTPYAAGSGGLGIGSPNAP